MPPCVTCHHSEAGFCAAAFRSTAADPQQNRGQQEFTVVPARKQIVTQHSSSDQVFVLCAGWAFRYVQRADGARQIERFLIPGDLFSSISIFEDASHFSAKALTDVQICGFPRSEIREKCFADRGFHAVVAQSCVVDGRDAAKLIAVLGRSSAEQRIAYLFLHLTERIAARHVVRDRRYPLPLRHQHIADAVGLTTVHVSRVLSVFRERGILTLSGGVLEVLDLRALEVIGLR